MKKMLFLMTILFSSLSLFAHGDETVTDKTLEVHAYNYGFEIAEVDIHPGDEVTLVLYIDEGHHGIKIPEFDIKSGNLRAGSVAEFFFTAPEAGDYDIICNVYCGPGHRDMRNVITITENE